MHVLPAVEPSWLQLHEVCGTGVPTEPNHREAAAARRKCSERRAAELAHSEVYKGGSPHSASTTQQSANRKGGVGGPPSQGANLESRLALYVAWAAAPRAARSSIERERIWTSRRRPLGATGVGGSCSSRWIDWYELGLGAEM